MNSKTLLILTLTLFTKIAGAKKTYDSISLNERRPFSIGALLGHGESRILNSDGTFASFVGTAMGLESTYSMISLNDMRFDFFLRYSQHSQKHKAVATDQINNTQLLLGIKTFLTSNFFLGLGYGTNSINFKTSQTEFDLSSNGPLIGTGYEFFRTESTSTLLNLWYANAPIRYTSTINSNSYTENYIVFLTFSWSPFINYEFRISQ